MTRAVLLPLERDWFALPLAALQEVVAAPQVTPVPTAPPTVRGLFNVRARSSRAARQPQWAALPASPEPEP